MPHTPFAGETTVELFVHVNGRHKCDHKLPQPDCSLTRCLYNSLQPIHSPIHNYYTMNTIQEIRQINEQELARGMAGTPASWHSQYAQSAWIYVGNVDHQLSEGDVLCVLSQYGELTDLHLVRNEDTGQSRGFGFAKYEDARSCILAVDNLCGIQLCGRSLRVDHVQQYRVPQHILDKQEEHNSQVDITQPGLAYHGQELKGPYSLQSGQDLFAKKPTSDDDDDDDATSEEDAYSSDSHNDNNNHNKDNSKEAKLARKEERRRIREERARKRQAKLEAKQKKHKKEPNRHENNNDDEKRRHRKKRHDDDDRDDDKDDRRSRKKHKKHKRSRRKEPRDSPNEKDERTHYPPRQRYYSDEDD